MPKPRPIHAADTLLAQDAVSHAKPRSPTAGMESLSDSIIPNYVEGAYRPYASPSLSECVLQFLSRTVISITRS